MFDDDGDFEVSNGRQAHAEPTPEGGSVARDLPNVETVEALDPELALLYRGARAEEVRKRAVERQQRRDEEEEQKRKREETARRARYLEEQASAAIVLSDSDDEPFDFAASAPKAGGSSSASASLVRPAAVPLARSNSDDSVELMPAPPPPRTSGRATRSTASSATPAASARAAKAGAGGSSQQSSAPAASGPEPAPPAPTADEDDGERITITLRGGATGQLEMNVRPRMTTTMAKLLDLALNQWSDDVPPGAKAKARIVYDGEVSGVVEEQFSN